VTVTPLVLVLALGARSAAPSGDLDLSPGRAGKESAWSVGVSPEDRHKAELLFREGNALLKESIVGSAAARYREALRHWDHPNIHFNLALALMVLDQPIETREQIVLAMKYGAAPMGNERFEHAKNYLSLLESQLAQVKVTCDTPGAKVEVDGRPLFEPPGEWKGFLRAGRHAFVASKAGMLTNQTVKVLDGGKLAEIDLELKTIEDSTKVRRRWAVWKPWAVVAAGAAVTLGAGAFHYAGVQKLDWVDTQSRARCPAPSGCSTEPSDLASARSTARTYQGIAFTGYAVGGAILAAGATLAWLNRAQTYVEPYSPEAVPPAPGKPAAPAAARPSPNPRVEVWPVLGGDTTGVVATLRF
jgi:hypothetical protein